MNETIEILEQAIYDGVIELECICGNIERVEPDAHAVCQSCESIIDNPLLKYGMI